MSTLQLKLNVKLRFATVCYRDWSDLDARIQCFDFTDDINQFKLILQNIECFGGKLRSL